MESASDKFEYLQTAIDHFVANNTRMEISCWYLTKYIKENCSKECQDLVIKE